MFEFAGSTFIGVGTFQNIGSDYATRCDAKRGSRYSSRVE